MMFGFLILKKRYTLSQIVESCLAVEKNLWRAEQPVHPRQLCVAVVSAGAILATVSRRSTSATSATATFKSQDDARKYIIGVLMMVISSVATGILGLLQELTYKTYGPCWKEGVFYTV